MLPMTRHAFAILAALITLPLHTMSAEENLSASGHPFLLCTRDQFPELRARAAREPWTTMAADARRQVEEGFNGDFRSGLQRYIGACALVYILDEENPRENAERVRDAIQLLEQVEFNPAKKWMGTVFPMGAAFVAILALDLAHDDLSDRERADLESLIERQIGKINRRGAWLAARLGTHGTWALYNHPDAGRTDDFRRRFIQPFYRNYLKQMTDGGVSTVSPGYAFARLGSGADRPQKTAFADVLEFTGIDNRYYNNPKLENFYRWLFSHSVTPAKEYHLFGDVGPYWGFGNSALFWRVGRFDERAAAHAAWLLEGREPPGHILSYLLMTRPLPAPVVPRSRLYMEGGAFFRESPDSPMSLGAFLYNITANSEYHTHEESNGIGLAGYGNNLLVNGGWLGKPTWPADRNNTLSINGADHRSKTGGGLVEGFTSHGFDYAVGTSGDALGDDDFLRTLLLIHGTETAGGYFLTLDKVDADPGETAHHYLQLAATEPAEALVEKAHYRASIDHHATVEGVSLDVFYASDPETVEQTLLPSGTLDRAPKSGKHQRLKGVFSTDAEGDVRLLTLLVPSNEDHPPADLRRISGNGFHGVAVGHPGGSTDYALMEDGTGSEGEMQGRLAVFRTRDEDTDFYFMRQGQAFRRGAVGFSSDAPISLFTRGANGHITSDGAAVTFHAQGITGVRLDGEEIDAVPAGTGAVTVRIPPGQHPIRLTP